MNMEPAFRERVAILAAAMRIHGILIWVSCQDGILVWVMSWWRGHLIEKPPT